MKKAVLAILVVGLLGVLSVGIGCLESDEHKYVEVIDISVDSNLDGTTWVWFTLTNTGDQDFDVIEVEVEVYTGDELMGYERGFIENLVAGGSKTRYVIFEDLSLESPRAEIEVV